MTRVSTFYQNQANLRQLQQSNEAITKASYQSTTGNKYQGLGDMGGAASQILTLDDVKQRIDTYSKNITTAKNTLAATEQSLNGMSDILTQATALATQARNESSADTRASLAPKAQALVESFYTTLKSQFNGNYLFSGQNGGTAPVTTDPAAAAYPGNPLPTTWYTGDQQTNTVMTGPGTTQSYGVTGDNSAFSSLKAGLEALWYGLQNNSPTDIDQATAAFGTAKTGVTTLLGTVGGQTNGLDQVASRYTDQQTLLKTQSGALTNVDTAEAFTTYQQQMAVMQASMQIIASGNQMSLLNYLK